MITNVSNGKYEFITIDGTLSVDVADIILWLSGYTAMPNNTLGSEQDDPNSPDGVLKSILLNESCCILIHISK